MPISPNKIFNSLKISTMHHSTQSTKACDCNLIVLRRKSPRSSKKKKDKERSFSSTKINSIKPRLKSRKSSWDFSLSWTSVTSSTHSICSCFTVSTPIFLSFFNPTKRSSLCSVLLHSQSTRQKMRKRWKILGQF
jgi:hypothetical protein